MEAIRINDRQLQNLESSGRLNLEDFLSDSDSGENDKKPGYETITNIGFSKITKPSTKPLPMVWESYESDDEKHESYLSSFSSIEQASTILRKEGWTW